MTEAAHTSNERFPSTADVALSDYKKPVAILREAQKDTLFRLARQRRSKAQTIARIRARIATYEAFALDAIDSGDAIRIAEASHSAAALEKVRFASEMELDRIERAISWLKRGLGPDGGGFDSVNWKLLKDRLKIAKPENAKDIERRLTTMHREQARFFELRA